MKLAFGLRFSDIQPISGYKKLQQEYDKFAAKQTKKGLVNRATELQGFLAQLFGLEAQLERHRAEANQQHAIDQCRDVFIKRVALPKYMGKKLDQATDIIRKVEQILPDASEQKVARAILTCLEDEASNGDKLDLFAKYVTIKVKEGHAAGLYRQWHQLPNDNKLLPSKVSQAKRDLEYSYKFRDKQINATNSIDQANYCLICHTRHLDTCRTGLPRKLAEKPGCPLDQKISEMNQLRQQGHILAALAVIMLDNPLLPLTGHRICNDCMQGCIFQKQEPVNVPVTESEILQAVLQLPYGFEIYNLLAWWNPLRSKSIAVSNAANILVAGSGPAGIAASYYFLLSGHKVTNVEGMQVLDLPFDGTLPIRNWQAYISGLDNWLANGFGGVAEYGITHRFDKNNLLLVRILLERHQHYKLIGACRLGSNLTIEQAFDYGADHIALCIGAGKPRYLKQQEYFANNIMAANEFLMRLHLENSFHKHSRPRFIIKLPVVIIGCGLTAIDSAVEALQYYPRQVANIASRYNAAILAGKQSKLAECFSPDELAHMQTFLQHHRQLSEAQSSAQISSLLLEFGGVRIFYHKQVKQSPAYRRNHEEIEQALACGVEIHQHHIISQISKGAIEFSHKQQLVSFGFGTLMLAIGLEPNKFIDLYHNFDTTYKDSFFKTKDHRISYFGDANEHYNGSVVKAIASVKDGHQHINQALILRQNGRANLTELHKDVSSIIVSKEEISPNSWHIVIASKLTANNYKAGQIFRLSLGQLHYTLAPIKVDKASGTIEFLLQNKKIPPDTLLVGGRTQLMGPVGAPLDTTARSTLLLATETSLPPMLGIYNSIKHKTKARLFCVGKRVNSSGALSADISYANNKEAVVALLSPEPVLGEIQVISALNDKLHSQLYQRLKNIYPSASFLRLTSARMLCMMKGICGSCLSYSQASGYYFACEQQFSKKQKIGAYQNEEGHF